MAHDRFIALVARLEQASDALRRSGCLIQAVARRYYLVYAYASQAAEKHGVTFRRGGRHRCERQLTHQALPDVIQALYSGQNFGAVLGGGPRRDPAWAIDRRSGVRLCSRLAKGPQRRGLRAQPSSRAARRRHGGCTTGSSRPPHRGFENIVMTANSAPSAPVLDLDSARRVLRRANAYVLAQLPALVDVRTLREGDFGDDYFVDVPCARLLDVTDRLAQLAHVVSDRFDVGLDIMRIVI
jgi:hypothetical protein